MSFAKAVSQAVLYNKKIKRKCWSENEFLLYCHEDDILYWNPHADFGYSRRIFLIDLYGDDCDKNDWIVLN